MNIFLSKKKGKESKTGFLFSQKKRVEGKTSAKTKSVEIHLEYTLFQIQTEKQYFHTSLHS